MNLDNYRAEIDKIDDEILKLFKRRMFLGEGIVRYKIENKLPVFDPQRERDILRRICSSCDENMQRYARTLFSTLFELNRAHQNTFIKAMTISGDVK